MSSDSAPKKFVGLHSHSTNSAGDAIGTPQDHIDFVLSNGGDALALTDHGNMNGFSSQYLHAKKLKDKGVDFRPIYGCESYFIPSLSEWRKLKDASDTQKAAEKAAKKTKSPVETIGDELASAKEELEVLAGVAKTGEDEEGGTVVENETESKSSSKHRDPIQRRNHLVLLAKNSEGLKALFRLVSGAYIDGFYRYPRIDFEALKKEAKGNLVASTACIASPMMHTIALHQTEPDFNKWVPNDLGMEEIQADLKELIERFKDALGEENFNLELQWNRLGCITGDAKIQTSEGLVNLQHVVGRRCQGEPVKVLSYNTDAEVFEYKNVTWGDLTHKKAKVVKVKLVDGKTITLTPNHKLFTDKGWMEAQDLKKYPGIKILTIS